MSRPTVLIILGILTALTPYSGLPLSILNFVLPLLGLAVIGVGLVERAERKRQTPSTLQTVSSYESPGA